MKDYYSALGIKTDAKQEEIKKSFRKLANKFHPDKNSDPKAEASFKEINEAYSILGDTNKRAEYDRQRNYGHSQSFGASPNFNDAWSEFFGDFGDIFNQRKPNQRNTESRSRKKKSEPPNPSVRFNIPLNSLLESEVVQVFEHGYLEGCIPCSGLGGSEPSVCGNCNGHGEVRVQHSMGSIQIQSAATCSRCRGSGTVFKVVCNSCRGSGSKKKKKKYKIKIVTEEV